MEKKTLEDTLARLIKEKSAEALKKTGYFKSREEKQTAKTSVKASVKEIAQPLKASLKEAVVATPASFVLKTEKLSKRTKEAHENIYRSCVDKFNKTSSALDGVNKQDSNSFTSLYRSLKMDECTNLNAVKLHELYFDNISDLASEIGVDSLPYIRLSRDFGTFENWQFDFIAAAMASREGWALLVYEPYKNIYMNVCVDGDSNGIPLGAIPVLAMDMWSHAFFKDYDIDKKSYLVSMMREINWDVVEARMVVAHRADLNVLYAIKPIYNDNPDRILNSVPDTNAPIDQIVDPTQSNQPKFVSPNTPAETETPFEQEFNNSVPGREVR